MTEESKDKDSLDELLEEAQQADPMHQKGEPTPIPQKDDPIEKEPLTPFKEEKQIIKMEAPAAPPASTPELDGLVSKFLSDAMKIAKRAQDRFEEDRAEVQEVIDHLKNKVFNGLKPSSAELESLVAALRVKTDATANMSKLGDMIARIVSSGKGQMQEKTSAFDLDELNHIKQALSLPEFGDTPKDLPDQQADKSMPD